MRISRSRGDLWCFTSKDQSSVSVSFLAVDCEDFYDLRKTVTDPHIILYFFRSYKALFYNDQ